MPRSGSRYGSLLRNDLQALVPDWYMETPWWPVNKGVQVQVLFADADLYELVPGRHRSSQKGFCPMDGCSPRCLCEMADSL